MRKSPEKKMEPNFKASEFLKMSPAERVKWCRSMAQEAEDLASKAGPQLRTVYKDLAKQWTLLAEEIARETRVPS